MGHVELREEIPRLKEGGIRELARLAEAAPEGDGGDAA